MKTTSYNKQLTRFNVLIKGITPKQIFERYSAIEGITIGKEEMISFAKDNEIIKGKFEINRNLNELVFAPNSSDVNAKAPQIEFVNYVAKKLDITYQEALSDINREFKLGLIKTENEVKNFAADFLYARVSGILERTYNPVDNLPIERKEGIFFLNGIELLGVGGLSMIIGQPGSGKSQICEILTAKFCDPSIDGLGYSFKRPAQGKILYLDMERSEAHLYNAWQKFLQRTKLSNETANEHAIYLSYKSVANRQPLENRKTKLERDIYLYQPSILIIDGVAKLIDDINNLNECNEFNRWLCNLAEENGFGVILTIHANPSDMKAQGHLGSVLLRECESVLALKYDKTKGNTQRFLTTDFQHGKVRGDSDKVETCFEWSQEQNGFISTEKKVAPPSLNSPDVLKDIVKKAFEGKIHLSYKELANQMAKLTGNTYETERKKIGRLIELEYILLDNSFYFIHPSIIKV